MLALELFARDQSSSAESSILETLERGEVKRDLYSLFLSPFPSPCPLFQARVHTLHVFEVFVTPDEILPFPFSFFFFVSIGPSRSFYPSSVLGGSAPLPAYVLLFHRPCFPLLSTSPISFLSFSLSLSFSLDRRILSIPRRGKLFQ